MGYTVTDVLAQLKARARKLHKQAEKGSPLEVARLRAFPGFVSPTDDELIAQLKRRHCLSVIAMEVGFRGWAQLAHVLEGGDQSADFGTLLCPGRMMPHQNIWFAHYSEAVEVRHQHGGYLLGYKKQYFVADGDFLLDLGLDPEADDWESMGRNWIQPGDLNARARLYARLFAERLPV
ncbi:MAG: hypothetical protein COA62_00685 [Rhodobiaceae bacterium]|nr:MAG: hypothetical protein COA62_00685 [Rhodobiaceae bacterium]